MPLLQRNEGREDLLDDQMLALWSPKDLNLTWFLDVIFYIENYYTMIFQCKTFKEKLSIYKKMALDENLNNPELVMEFAMLSLNSFKIITWIIQHFCSRMNPKQLNGLMDAIEKGVFVLYDYVYCYWAGNNEELIIGSILSELPKGVILASFDDAFTKGQQRFKDSSKHKYRSVDYGAPALFVDVKSESSLVEKVSEVKQHMASRSGMNLQFIAPHSLRSSSVLTSSSNLKTAETKFVRQAQTVTLNAETQEKLFPTKWTPGTNPASSYRYLFTRKHGENVPPPMFIIKVPWTQATGIVSRHENFYMEDGFAFLDYTQISMWMRDFWHSAVTNARRWDNINIIWPWLDMETEAYQDVIPINVDMSHSEFVEYLKKFNDKTFHVPLTQLLANGLFFLEEEKESDDPNSLENLHKNAVTCLYKTVFEQGHKLQAMLRTRLLRMRQHVAESSSTSGLPSENEIFYQPLETNVTGNFMSDYGRIMPPCIKLMYETHMNGRTHFRNDERLKFFWWAFKASVPLDTLMEMWSVMIDNDSTVNQKERKSLIQECTNIYTRQQRNRDADNEFNYYGCQKMENYCPFAGPVSSSSSSIGDLEDLGKVMFERKLKCGGHLYDSKTPVPNTGVVEQRWPHVHLRRWSPMTATAILSQYYLNKI